MSKKEIQETNEDAISTDIKPEDIVYRYDHWIDTIVKCQVESISEYNIAKLKDLEVVNCNGDRISKSFGYCSRAVIKLFSTPLDAYNDYWIKFSTEVRKLCKQIKTIEDLILFPTKYPIDNNDNFKSNDVAFMAYKIRAKELANVDIKTSDWKAEYKAEPKDKYGFPVATVQKSESGDISEN